MGLWGSSKKCAGLLPLLLALSVQAQNAPTLKLSARLVYVDVTVRDSHGHTIHGLKPEDFKLLEDGKEQNFRLDVHSDEVPPTQAAEPAKVLAGPAGQGEFTNTPEVPGNADSINMVLLDLLSTPQVDQLYARQQLIAFLRALPKGRQVALFVLTDRLHMLQSFTGSSDRLIAAAQALNPKDLTLIHSQAEQIQDADWTASFVALIGRSAAGAVKPFEPLVAAQNSEQRDYITQSALRQLARATAGFQGRKNLLWLAEDFPIALGSELKETRFIDRTVAGSKATSELLAKSRIAIYPISLAGLETGGVSASANGIGETNGLGGKYGMTLGEQSAGRHDAHEQMNRIATETGGRAAYGSNDFAGLLAASLDDGSNYYALIYSPENHNYNGKFRDVKVELARKGYTLSYRRGYFALPDSTAAADPDSAFSVAMQPATPESTMVRLSGKLLPPDPAHPGVVVESTIAADSLDFTTSADGHHHAKLRVTLVALEPGEDQPLAPPQSTGELNLDLEPARYQIILEKGIAFRQQLALKPGRYRLRLGVRDEGNHRIGTLDMPVVVSGN
jgi:VWFA-related protein